MQSQTTSLLLDTSSPTPTIQTHLDTFLLRPDHSPPSEFRLLSLKHIRSFSMVAVLFHIDSADSGDRLQLRLFTLTTTGRGDTDSDDNHKGKVTSVSLSPLGENGVVDIQYNEPYGIDVFETQEKAGGMNTVQALVRIVTGIEDGHGALCVKIDAIAIKQIELDQQKSSIDTITKSTTMHLKSNSSINLESLEFASSSKSSLFLAVTTFSEKNQGNRITKETL